jgi:uncharacterized protein
MPRATFRFYEELNDFLPPARRKIDFSHEWSGNDSIKHLIEALGVPHPEVDLILVNGQPVDFAYRPRDGDRISVYPVFESWDVSAVTRLRPQPLRETRFVLDGHLGRLAAYVRLLGFDAVWQANLDDAALAQISQLEHRILLTRDRGLLKRTAVTHGYCIRSDMPRQQLREVIERFDLTAIARPFTRCLSCNGLLAACAVDEVKDQLSAQTLTHYTKFWRCTTCGRAYWQGSHYRRLTQLVHDALDPRPADE